MFYFFFPDGMTATGFQHTVSIAGRYNYDGPPSNQLVYPVSRNEHDVSFILDGFGLSEVSSDQLVRENVGLARPSNYHGTPSNHPKEYPISPNEYDGSVAGRPYPKIRPNRCNCTKGTQHSPDANPLQSSNTSRQEISEEAQLFLTGPVSTILIPSFYSLVCLISLPINICAGLVFIKKIKIKKPAVIYMLNLVCADLLFAMVLPFKISYRFNGNNWIFGPAMCRVVTAAFYWNMYCSVLLIALISVDRLLAVVYPIDSLSWRSPRKAIIACVAAWFLSFAGSMDLLFTEQTFHLKQLGITTCHDIQPSQLFLCHKMYFVTLCCLLFFLPLIITLVSYTRVIMTLSKDQPGVPDHSLKKRRAVFLSGTVLVMFVLCFTPTNLVLIMQKLKDTEGAQIEDNADILYIVYLIFLCLGSLNCLLDPLVYYFGSSQFQKELFSMLGWKKKTQGTSGGPSSSSDPSSSTSQPNMKSNHQQNYKINTPPTKSDSSQANLCSQCKKQLV
ncbi:proteinase-activated receptor 1-like [Labrus mixtus]|uniref:proteinase-activated receptor 1-like n=1 Tax=Labrus mixtus TaxID=508554 RepID=UPI0029C03CAD|nr:proteinase-activated receptor 1-like [Labrus mixtus]